eukprot:g10677.t1
MPEWAGKQTAAPLDISPGGSPTSSTSSFAPPAQAPEPPLPPPAATSRPVPPTPPPRPTALAEQPPPQPPSTTAPTPPRQSRSAGAAAAAAAAVAGPETTGIPRPTKPSPPSYDVIARAAGAAPTGGAPPPSESAPPSVDTTRSVPRPPRAQEVPQQTAPRAAARAWPAAAEAGAGAGAAAGSKGAGAAGTGVAGVAPALPPSATKNPSRASPMRPQGKGTPARRRAKKTAPPSVPAKPTTATPSAAPGGGGNVGRHRGGEAAPAARRPSPLSVEAELAPAPAPAPPRSPSRPQTGALARRMLDIEVVEAAGLLGTEKGGVSNPRADVLLVDLGGRPIKSEGVKKTSVVKGTTNPVWNYKVSFGHRVNLSAPVGGNMPTLRVQVFSEQRFAGDKPLGMVDINLMNLSEDGEESQQDYSLEPFGRLRAGGRLGSINLRLKIGAVVNKRDASSKIIRDLKRSADDRGDEDHEYFETPPNFLRITLHQAQDLQTTDSVNTCDPFVIFNLDGKEQRSSIAHKTLNPRWEEVFEFECTSSGEALEITVKDKNRFVNDFLGFVSILMGDLEDKRKMRQWFDLKLKSGLAPAEDRRAIEITTQWFYNPNIAAKDKTKKAGFVDRLLHTADSDTDGEEGEEEEVQGKDDPNQQIRAKEEKEADPKEQEEKEKAKKKLLSELSDFKVVSGDYVAYVHIIEVRELKGEDLQGTSDPVVYVEAFGQRFATEVVKDRLNAVFDETFVINLRNIDQDDFKEGVFRISVMDADVPIAGGLALKTDLIGAVSFDATYIYQNKDHEVHRRWVALVDDENPDDVGIQGYLHLSIAIVGPGDKLKVHDEEADRRRERAAEANIAGGMDSLVVMPPTIEVQQKWLVTTVVKAEYLPIMDSKLIGGSSGDFFFQVEVAGGKPLRTRKVTLNGDRHRLNPEWRNELWQPVTTPFMSGNVKFSIWDWDRVGENELVGVYYGKLRQIERNTQESAKGRPATRWSVGNRQVAWRKKIKAPPVPKAAPYALRVFVASGTEIPQFTDVTLGANPPGKKKMWIRVSVGRYELTTDEVDNLKGVCEWYNDRALKNNFNLPADPDDVPDVIIHLMAGTGSGALPCSFTRIPAKELIEENFGGTPKWFRLQEDKVLDCLYDNEFPGSVLVRIGFGPIESYVNNKSKWTDDFQGLLKKEPYELRVHLFQARNLPATDSNGLIDPYLNVKFKGQTICTEDNKDLRRRETVDPVWYHTLRFSATLPPKEYQKYFPQVTIQLYDHNQVLANTYAGNLFLDLQDLEIIQADRRTETLPAPPTPTWESFFMESPGDGYGELLVSTQLIHTKSADMPEPQSIIPETRLAYLDMVIMGIRNMRPYKYLPMQLPYCVFEVDDMDGTKRTVLTDTSNKPTGRDANFLQHIKLEVRLPLDVIYAPRVKIRVYDTRLGGFNVPLVGSGRIELGKKLPWSEEYEAPLAKTFAREALLRAIDGADSGDVFNDDDDDDDERKSDTSAIGNGRARSTRPGGGFSFGSDYGSDDDNYSDFGAGGAAGGMVPGGTSGFGAGGFGGAGASSRRVYGGGGRTSRRVFGQARSSRSRSRTDFGGGGGGALDLLREDSGAVDNTPQLNASGQVIDTGIGVMPALDLARQKAGLPPTPAVSTPVAAAGVGGGVGGAAAGVLGGTGAGTGGSVRAGVSAGGGGVVVPVGGGGEDWEEEDEFSQIPNYLKGREELEQSLEEELSATPFESYDIFRGQVLGAIGGGSDLQKVGKLKCIVRVTKGDPDNDPLFVDKRNFPTLDKAKAKNAEIMAELLKPKHYKVRLYVLQALNLTPMDLGIGGRPGKSDPYLRVRLGKESFNDKKNYIDDVTDADFYKVIELNSTLPGASQLQIDVVDYDDIGRDELIGRTTIDLEDRWFDTRWQAWGLQNRSEELNNMRFQTKPLETRTLLVPTSLAPQGQLRCWLDIMSTEDARAFPPDDVSLPPNLDFEVRVVFWKCKDVVSMDTVTDQNDLFVRSWVEGCDSQETDTHWFAKKGKGSFNWRMKFKVSLGPRTRAWKFPYLTVQLWDRDLFKYNDHIAEGQLDLGPYFIKAYKTRDTVKLFHKIDPKIKEEMQKADLANMDVDARLGNNADNERLIAANLESGPAAYDPEMQSRPPPPAYGGGVEAGGSGSSAVVGGVNDLYQGSPVPPQASSYVPPAPAAPTAQKKRKRGCCALVCPCCCGRTKAAQVEPGGEDEDAEAAADAKAFVSQIKGLTGLWEEDPDESYWLNMERTNYSTGQKDR